MFLTKKGIENCNLKASNAICNLVLFYMSFVCHWYHILMYSYVTRMLFVCYSYVLVCHPYVSHTSLVCTLISPVCHSYAVWPWIETLEQELKYFKSKKKTPGRLQFSYDVVIVNFEHI